MYDVSSNFGCCRLDAGMEVFEIGFSVVTDDVGFPNDFTCNDNNSSAVETVRCICAFVDFICDATVSFIKEVCASFGLIWYEVGMDFKSVATDHTFGEFGFVWSWRNATLCLVDDFDGSCCDFIDGMYCSMWMSWDED